MQNSVALQRYLQRHIEAALPTCPQKDQRWHRALVIPAYRESAALLQQLKRLPEGSGRTLVILVLNRPDTDTDPDANTLLRAALERQPGASEQPCTYTLNAHSDLYLHDMDKQGGPVPAAQGVGLARKTGCDIALQWMSEGAISGAWIYSSDADARLPVDYFQKTENNKQQAVAAVYPFRHVPGADQDCNEATALYELRLHHYVLGLEYAGSPYAHHTLGSCLAVRANAYTQVRGFPKRAGGEDFYLLNKLAKLGPVAKLKGTCIELQSRHSNRAPFGTGPAVAKITRQEHPTESTLFYHPACYEALRALLNAAPSLYCAMSNDLPALLRAQGLNLDLAQAASTALEAMGLTAALLHCRRQGK